MQDDINLSLDTLNRGGIILYPTDTVWGIGCDATNEDAIENIYKVKKRDETRSMLILVDSIDMLSLYVRDIPGNIRNLIEHSAKPTSIIYPEARNLPANLIAKDGSIGIRIVKDEFCQRLIGLLKRPLVSTSANISGERTPDFFGEISDEVRSKMDYIVHWRREDRRVTPASSVVKFDAAGTLVVLR